MKEEAMNHRMRIYTNGPDVKEFCRREMHGTETTYHAGALCKKSQALYRKYFGAKTLQGRERRCKRRASRHGGEAAISNYKNKGKKTGMKIGHMAHHLQEKWKQAMKTKTGKVSDMDKLLLQKLSETTAEPNKVQAQKRKEALDNKVASGGAIGEVGLKEESSCCCRMSTCRIYANEYDRGICCNVMLELKYP